ncbi:MAG: hypothetical protein M0P71_01915 [Melioribacteraceae bacterium]|nr:hypothetical protein [Melioribacteraceae bacterium]
MKYKIYLLIIAAFFAGCTTQKETLSSNIEFSTKGKMITVYTTAEGNDLRLSRNETDLTFKKGSQPIETEISVFVNPNKKFQEFLGIGGAITDASAEVFAVLSHEKQQELLTAYYDKDKGIGYSLARTTIHSCDFSSGSYTYIKEGDKELNSFSIDHDKRFRIPLIQKATETAGGSLLLYASPWSPPAFMKTNKDMLHGGKLLPEYYDSWAMYYTKFIKAYETENLPIWGITVQNEPMAVQTWESSIFTAEEERDFLKYHLGPVMEKENLGDKKILVWDHNRDLITQRANTIYDDPDAAKYAWGTAFHWYESWTGAPQKYDNIAFVRESYPDKKLFFTEGCAMSFDSTKYQFWGNGERYGLSMINDFNNGTVAWTDWNILLDDKGGPNHVQNYCFAPVHLDGKTGDLIYTPSYYYIGHFSKFIRPNARRISTTTSRATLSATSFLNENGRMVTVIMNQTDEAIDYGLYVEMELVNIKIPAHAIQSIIY